MYVQGSFIQWIISILYQIVFKHSLDPEAGSTMVSSFKRTTHFKAYAHQGKA